MWKPRKAAPVFSSLSQSTLPGERPATPEERAVITRAAGPGWAASKLVFENASLNAYRLRAPDRPDRLLRIDDADEAGRLTRDYALSVWLHARGVPTPEPLTSPRPLPRDEGAPSGGPERVFSQRAFVAHRAPGLDDADMTGIGAGVARLHAALDAHPDRQAWARTTQDRMAALESVRRALAEGALRAGPEPDRLRALAGREDLDFTLPEAPRFALHGDLNRGNLYMTPQGGFSVLDFEDVAHSVLPPVFELAFLIERHALVPAGDAGKAEAGGRGAQALWRAYRDAAPSAHAAALANSDLAAAVRAINLRSLCVLALAETQGGQAPAGEWAKFFDLFERADRTGPHGWADGLASVPGQAAR